RMRAVILLLLLSAGIAGSQPGAALPRRRLSCVRCCGPSEQPVSILSQRSARTSACPQYPVPKIRPTIDITILKGGCSSLLLAALPPGPGGRKGQKGQPGPQGRSCQQLFAAFSVGRRQALHGSDVFQRVTFDTEFVNLYRHFDTFSGKFFCRVPGVYYFSLNVHTWNFKETYVHLMRNEQAAAVLYAQPSDRSVMQSQSLMLDLREGDEVWVRMFKRERENAIYSEESDVYVVFNGHLVKPALE
ncbi:C1QT8 protein, partial [Donacobius atricapilla]|nr:C1QT8 protein [Donacobius atricapilla]